MNIESAVNYGSEVVSKFADIENTHPLSCHVRTGFAALYCGLGDWAFGVGITVLVIGFATDRFGRCGIPLFREWGNRIMWAGGGLMIAGLGIQYGLSYPTH